MYVYIYIYIYIYIYRSKHTGVKHVYVHDIVSKAGVNDEQSRSKAGVKQWLQVLVKQRL